MRGPRVTHLLWFPGPLRTRAAAAVRWLPVLVVGALVAGCTSSFAAYERIPPRSASPEQVARSYLRAAKAGDCRLTATLTLPDTWSWCRDPRLLDYRAVGSASPLSPPESARDEECVPFEMNTRGSSDGSMPVGWQPWGLCLVRTSSGWRLYDQGTA